jgi:hypothetical protein
VHTVQDTESTYAVLDLKERAEFCIQTCPSWFLWSLLFLVAPFPFSPRGSYTVGQHVLQGEETTHWISSHQGSSLCAYHWFLWDIHLCIVSVSFVFSLLSAIFCSFFLMRLFFCFLFLPLFSPGFGYLQLWVQRFLDTYESYYSVGTSGGDAGWRKNPGHATWIWLMECVCTLGKDVGDKCFVPQHSRIKKIARQETAPGPHKEGKSAGLSVRCLESRKPSYKLLPLSFYSTWLGWCGNGL